MSMMQRLGARKAAVCEYLRVLPDMSRVCGPWYKEAGETGPGEKCHTCKIRKQRKYPGVPEYDPDEDYGVSLRETL